MIEKVDPVSYIRRRFGNETTVSFMPNGGNLGDNLIAAATIQQFERQKLDWRILEGGQENIRPSDIIVYGGGGSLVGLYQGAIEALSFLLTLERPVVVFPQTVRDHREFWLKAPYMVVFCRDMISYEYMRQYPQIESLLADDMAAELNISVQPYLSIKNYRQEIVKKNLCGPILKAFREDGEASNRQVDEFSIDLSTLGNPTMQTRHEIEALAVMFLMSVASAQEIYTDRLHVAVAAGLQGIQTHLFDNVYGKNRDIYESTLSKRFPSIKFLK